MSAPIKIARPEPADPTKVQAAVFWARRGVRSLPGFTVGLDALMF